MWYKNKITGNTWDITDKNILKRISKDSNYEVYEPEEIEELPFVADDEPEEELEEIEEVEEPEEVKTVTKKVGASRGSKSATTKAKK